MPYLKNPDDAQELVRAVDRWFSSMSLHGGKCRVCGVDFRVKPTKVTPTGLTPKDNRVFIDWLHWTVTLVPQHDHEKRHTEKRALASLQDTKELNKAFKEYLAD